MAKVNRHIVQKQIFNLTLRKSKDSAPVQQKVSTICKNQLTPLIEELFSRLVNDDELIRIDKLEIDIGAVSPDELEILLSEKIIAALEEKLLRLIADQSTEIQRGPLNLSHFEAWLVYLDRGTLPFQLAGMEETDIHRSVLESLASHPSSMQYFRSALLNKPLVLSRLVKQSKEGFLQSLLKSCFGTKQAHLIRLRKTMQDIILDMSAATLTLLFATHRISPRMFCIHFWKETILISLKENQPAGKSLLISHILQALSKQKKPSPELLEICKSVNEQKDPIKVLKFALLKLDQDQVVRSKSQDSDLPAKEDKEPPTHEKEQPFRESEPESPARDEELESKESSQKVDPPDDTETPQTTLRTAEQEREENVEGPLQQNQELTESPDEQRKPELKTPDGKEQEVLEVSNDLQDKPDETPERPDLETSLPIGSYYYIQHAGVVLLHPFLKTYFDKIGLIAADQFKDLEAREKAVHLLHYLSGGNDEPPEYDLILPKLLCNLALNFPVDRKVKLSKSEKKEGNKMLQAVIDHWGVLGRVGPNSLQEGFLHREGKLEKRAGGWHLMIERKTIDILLDKLPWGISLVKLPWMPDILNVEWNS